MTFPREGAAFAVDGMAMLHGAPEPQLAARFMEWMLGIHAQQLLASMHRIPLRSDVAAGKDLPGSEIKRITFSDARAARERKHVVELWREATGQ